MTTVTSTHLGCGQPGAKTIRLGCAYIECSHASAELYAVSQKIEQTTCLKLPEASDNLYNSRHAATDQHRSFIR